MDSYSVPFFVGGGGMTLTCTRLDHKLGGKRKTFLVLQLDDGGGDMLG